jgi:hypothetical protein
MSIELLPKNQAEASKVGEGRNEPNVNPYLPPPQGRFEWSLNPFKMFVRKIFKIESISGSWDKA